MILPKDLLLVHERSDHYSLQAAEEMTVLGRAIKMHCNNEVAQIISIRSEF